MLVTRALWILLALVVAGVACGDDGATPSAPCTPEVLGPSTGGSPNLFVRPGYVPPGFELDVFEDRGPRRVVLTGKETSGLVPVVDLQLFAHEAGAVVRTTPEIRQDAANKFSAKWDIEDSTLLATAAYVARDEFDKVVRSVTLVEATEFCAFVRDHDGRLFTATTVATR
jgi:hypothetical protein